MNFTGWGYHCQKSLRGWSDGPVKFTFARYPRQNALRGTLSFEVNFTGWGYPCQKYLRGRLDDLVKFTFRGDPLQNAFRGTLPFEVNFTGPSPSEPIRAI